MSIYLLIDLLPYIFGAAIALLFTGIVLQAKR